MDVGTNHIINNNGKVFSIRTPKEIKEHNQTIFTSTSLMINTNGSNREVTSMTYDCSQSGGFPIIFDGTPIKDTMSSNSNDKSMKFRVGITCNYSESGNLGRAIERIDNEYRDAIIEKAQMVSNNTDPSAAIWKRFFGCTKYIEKGKVRISRDNIIGPIARQYSKGEHAGESYADPRIRFQIEFGKFSPMHPITSLRNQPKTTIYDWDTGRIIQKNNKGKLTDTEEFDLYKDSEGNVACADNYGAVRSRDRIMRISLMFDGVSFSMFGISMRVFIHKMWVCHASDKIESIADINMFVQSSNEFTPIKNNKIKNRISLDDEDEDEDEDENMAMN